jgi:hypothetical protein
MSEGGKVVVVGAGGVGVWDEEMEGVDVSWFVRGWDRVAMGLKTERSGRSGILRVSLGRALVAFSTAILFISVWLG